MPKTNLTLSYQACAKITKNNSSFYLGILFTKKKYRNALYAIYAWMRAIDDIADNEQLSLEERTLRLNGFEEKTLKLLKNKPVVGDELLITFWPAFCDTVHHFHIPSQYFTEMIEGQRQDLTKLNYDSFDELYEYCHHAASTVGLIFITLFGYEKRKKTIRLAELCGVALQLTNILRDVQEDLKLQRVYLPADLSGVNHLTAANFKQIPLEQIQKGIQLLIIKTAKYYYQGNKLYPKLNQDGKLCFLIIVNSYQGLFKKIVNQPSSILQGKKIKLSRLDKITTLCKSFYQYLTLR